MGIWRCAAVLVTIEGEIRRVGRDKIGFGASGDYDDVSVATPLPVTDPTTVTALAALSTELAQKHEPTDLVFLSTAAKQDIAKSALDLLHADLTGTLKVKQAGTYVYAAGTAAGTVDVPTSARLTRVAVIAGGSVAATVTIGGGATITIPAGGSFDEQIPGDATNADVVIGGAVQSYYVAWVI